MRFWSRLVLENCERDMNSPQDADRRPATGWNKALRLAILWFAVGVIVPVPLLIVQAKVLLRNDRGVPGFSTAELVQTEFFAVMAVLALLIGWLHRSWKILVLLFLSALAGACVVGGLMFVLDPPFIGI
jgi:hypothetical protein